MKTNLVIEQATHNNACLMELIEGLEYTLQIFVGSDNINTDEVREDNLIINVMTLGLASTFMNSKKHQDEKFFKKHEDVGKAILNDMNLQLNAFRACWSPGEDFNIIQDLSDSGCLYFSIDKIKAYCIENYTNSSISEINERVVNIIRPFGKRFMKNLISEFINYWIIAYQGSPKRDQVTSKLQNIIEIISECKFNTIDFL